MAGNLTLKVEERGEVMVVTIEKTADGGFSPVELEKNLAARLKEFLSSSERLGVVLDFEAVSPVEHGLEAMTRKLNDILHRKGYEFIVTPREALGMDERADGYEFPLQMEDEKHVALGLLLSKVGVKKELLEALTREPTVHYSIEGDETEYKARFVKNIQSFILLDLIAPPPPRLAKGMRMKFMVELPEDKRGVFEATLHSLAKLKGMKDPLMIIKVPQILTIEDRRKDPRIEVNLRVEFWGITGDKMPRHGTVQNISDSGILIRTKEFPFREGDEILCDIDFEYFKFPRPVKCRIVRIEYDGREGMYSAGCEFCHLQANEEALLEDFLMRHF